MSADFENIHRVVESTTTDAVAGRVCWTPVKSLFLIFCYGMGLAGLVWFTTPGAVAVFVIKTGAVLLLGHSVGMHRRLIHNSFSCPRWLEYFLVYMGTLTGLGGPYTMILTHDMRDWAQRKAHCHDYFAHRRPPLVDAFWQMHCDIRLDHAPRIVPEPRIAGDRFYGFLERHWIAVHLPWAVAFYAVGGWGWVMWGVCAQIATTVTGHWLVGYMAHRDEAHGWRVKGAGVQGHNVPFCGLITMGECWHNNHHAFPGSALIGIEKGQIDPGWWFILALQRLGWAWDIRTHRDLPPRSELEWMGVKQCSMPP